VHDAATFGEAPAGSTHFKLTRYSLSGTAERCHLPQNGVAVENFPISMLQVVTIRRHWGPGTYRGQWMRQEGGHWKGCGRIREVQILSADPNAAPRAGVRVLHAVPEPIEFAPAERAPMRDELPPEVVDIRIRTEREITKMKLDAQQEIFDERRKLSDEQTAAQFRELRAEIARVNTSRALAVRSDDDDDDREPGPWDWVGPFLEKLRPTLEQVIPPLLSKLAKAVS
jgi:ribosomal protein L29